MSATKEVRDRYYRNHRKEIAGKAATKWQRVIATETDEEKKNRLAKRRATKAANREHYLRKSREWYVNNADKMRAWARQDYAKTKRGVHIARRVATGWTKEQYEAAFIAQGGVCACCGRAPERKGLAADHCHKSGRPRKLLCTRCNVGLGYLEHELRPVWEAYLKEFE